MRFGLEFSFQAPPGSGVAWSEPYRDMLDCLPVAEELGYVSAWIASHHVQRDGLCPSPLLALAGAAGVTRTMRLGTAVLLVPLYAPLKLAEDVAVLDCLSGGRFVFGVAPGYVSEEFEAHDVPRRERSARMEEALDLMIEAWSGRPVDFAGRFYRARAPQVTPLPVQQPHPPLWYGVSGPKALRRAAERRAVLVASTRHGLDELKEHYRLYDEAAAELGWRPTERPVIRAIYVAETRERAEAVAAPALEYLFRELYGAKSAANERELRTDDGSVVTDVAEATFAAFRRRFLVGTPDEVTAELERYERELGATEIICWTHLPGISGADALRSVRLFAREVMPALARPPVQV